MLAILLLLVSTALAGFSNKRTSTDIKTDQQYLIKCRFGDADYPSSEIGTDQAKKRHTIFTRVLLRNGNYQDSYSTGLYLTKSGQKTEQTNFFELDRSFKVVHTSSISCEAFECSRDRMKN